MCRIDWCRVWLDDGKIVSNCSVGYMLGGGRYDMVGYWNFGDGVEIWMNYVFLISGFIEEEDGLEFFI